MGTSNCGAGLYSLRVLVVGSYLPPLCRCRVDIIYFLLTRILWACLVSALMTRVLSNYYTIPLWLRASAFSPRCRAGDPINFVIIRELARLFSLGLRVRIQSRADSTESATKGKCVELPRFSLHAFFRNPKLPLLHRCQEITLIVKLLIADPAKCWLNYPLRKWEQR